MKKVIGIDTAGTKKTDDLVPSGAVYLCTQPVGGMLPHYVHYFAVEEPDTAFDRAISPEVFAEFCQLAHDEHLTHDQYLQLLIKLRLHGD